MTPEERQRLRHLIDQIKRKRIKQARGQAIVSEAERRRFLAAERKDGR